MRLTLFASLAIAATAAAQRPLPEWKLGAAPQVAIGGDGNPKTEFLNIRGAWRLSGGEVAIANSATNEIRVFNARGAHLYTFGRQGKGPGEFEAFGWTERFGDTVMTYDFPNRRISSILLRPAPRLLSEVPVGFEAVGREAWIGGRLADGRWAIEGLGMPDVQKTSGRYRIPGYVGVVNAKAAGEIKWLADVPDGDTFIYHPPGNTDAISIKIAAFPAAAVMRAVGPVIWYGDSKTDSLIRLNPATGERKKITLDPGAPVTKAMIDAGRARDLENARNRGDSAGAGIRYSADLVPKRLPTFDALVAGPGGELWVQRSAPSRTSPAEYLVLSASGTRVARVNVPAGLRITDVGRDYIVGIHKDDDGVESVRVYPLRR